MTNAARVTSATSRPPWTTGRTLAQTAAQREVTCGPLLPRLLLAAVGSGLTTLAFPPLGWWPVAPVGLAALLVSLRRQTARRGALLGLVGGLAMFLPLLHWSGVYVGFLPWFLLATLEATFVSVFGAAAAVVWRLPGAPVWLAALFVADEAARSRVPFGGFPWARVAFVSADSWFTPLAALGGAPLVSFALVLTAGLLAGAVVRIWPARDGVHRPPRGRAVAVLLLTAALVTLSGLVVPTPGGAARAANIAVVQGNVPRPGLEFNAERERVLRNHVDATEALARRVSAGTSTKPDVVLWPENSSDIDPFANPDAAAIIQQAADDIGAPILVGAVVGGPGRYLSNVGVVWWPSSGFARSGPADRYVKRHPAPFGEYIPLRSLARKVSDKVDLVARDFVAGKRVNTLDLGRADVADVICFEVAYDGLVRDVVAKGGDLLVVQTNNATFGYTAEASQQLAMTRLRAIEHGRATVQVSTVGISAIVRPDGSTVDHSSLFTRDVLEARVPLRTSTTVADRVGSWPEAVLSVLGVVALLLGVATRRRARSRR